MKLSSGACGARWQRLTSLVLIPLLVWLAPAMAQAPFVALDDLRAWLSRPLNGLAAAAFALVATGHAYLGLKVVLEDYVADLEIRGAAIKGVGATCILLNLMALASIFTLLKS